MIDRTDDRVSLVRQCGLVGISRSSLHSRPKTPDASTLELMRLLGLEAIYQKPRTSKPATGHKIYPYLLRDLVIDRPNQAPLSRARGVAA